MEPIWGGHHFHSSSLMQVKRKKKHWGKMTNKLFFFKYTQPITSRANHSPWVILQINAKSFTAKNDEVPNSGTPPFVTWGYNYSPSVLLPISLSISLTSSVCLLTLTLKRSRSFFGRPNHICAQNFTFLVEWNGNDQNCQSFVRFIHFASPKTVSEHNSFPDPPRCSIKNYL